MAPVDFFDRDPVFKEYFGSSLTKTRKEQLGQQHPVWIAEADRLAGICEQHKKGPRGEETEGRYVFYQGACHKPSCKSKHCMATVGKHNNRLWYPSGPSGPFTYSLYDKDREGHYMRPHASWAETIRTNQNNPDVKLPSKLLASQWAKSTTVNGKQDKSLSVSKEECHAIATGIKDTSITPDVVYSFFAQQRAIHLRRVRKPT